MAHWPRILKQVKEKVKEINQWDLIVWYLLGACVTVSLRKRSMRGEASFLQPSRYPWSLASHTELYYVFSYEGLGKQTRKE